MRLTEEQVIKQLWESADQYKPLTFAGFEETLLFSERTKADAVVRISVEDGLAFTALVEIVPVATPKNILQKSRSLRAQLTEAGKSAFVPVILAPYVGGAAAPILAREGISWIDLSGNMRVSVPGKIYIERTGNKNKFPDTAPIKKIFEGTSSLVSRALILKPDGFSSQYELLDFINSRSANITPGTVSRVLGSLENELLITKDRSRIYVNDTERLLDKLADGYTNYTRRKQRRVYKFAVQKPTCVSMRLNFNTPSNYLACGFYATQIKGLAATDEVTIFVKDLEQAKKDFDFIIPDSEFGDFKLIETKDTEIWFNSNEVQLTMASVIRVSIPVVDDLELYLEMMSDAPRGPKVAKLLKERILGVRDCER